MTLLNHHIVTCARHYLGVPFRHQGRNRETGVDCLGLLMMIAQDLHLCDAAGRSLNAYDSLEYSRHPQGDHLMHQLDNAMICCHDDPLASGQIALLSYDGNAQHLGIITDYYAGGFGIIHGYALSRKVTEHQLDTTWHKRIISRYTVIAHYSTFERLVPVI